MKHLSKEDTIVLNKTITLPQNGIICAHPGRVKKIATDYLKKTTLHTDYRGYQIYTGYYQGHEYFVANTGIGAPAAAFLIEELIAFGAKRIIRVGSNDSHFTDYKLNLVEETTLPLGLQKDYCLEKTNLIKVDPFLKFAITLKAHKLGISLVETSNIHVDGYYANYRARTGSSDMETGALYLLGQQYHFNYASILMSYPKHGEAGEYGNEVKAFELENMAIRLALMSLAA